MKIIEYEEKYLNDVRDLLTELEVFLAGIDQDNLDLVGKHYWEQMALNDLEDVKKYNGKCYLVIEDNKTIGLIMGIIRKYSEEDYLDYKCPSAGRVTELIISEKARTKGLGTILMNKMETYFKENNCQYSFVDVFSYNENANKFYIKMGFHDRMHDMIKRIG